MLPQWDDFSDDHPPQNNAKPLINRSATYSDYSDESYHKEHHSQRHKPTSRLESSSLYHTGRYATNSNVDKEDWTQTVKVPQPVNTRGIKMEINYVSKYLSNIEEYICKEADFDVKTCSFYNQDLINKDIDESHQQHGFSGHNDSDFSPEMVELKACGNKLKSGAASCMKAVAECFESRRTVYLAQLKKIRDISNMATRNAVQGERAEATAAITRLKNSYELRNNTALEEAHNKMHQLEQQNQELNQHIHDLRMNLDDLSLKDRERINIQNRAVDAALALRDEEQRQQKVQQTQWLENEAARHAAEAAAHVQAAVNQNKIVQETQQRHHNELREMLVVERNRLEKECVILREQLSASQMEVSLEKERSAARLTEERDRSERHLQDVLSESLRAQAQLKTELSEVALRMKAEDTRRANELDTKMARYRESLLTSNAMELEAVRERHQTEIKRMQAEMQVRAQDTAVKTKVMFDQELNRLIRDNERLQKIVVRNGGSAAFSQLNHHDDNLLSASRNNNNTSSYFNNLTPGKDIRSSSTSKFNSSGVRSGNKFTSSRDETASHWGSLGSSLRAQEEMESARPPPPVPFSVEEAYQSSLDGRSSGGGRGQGVGSNQKRVTGYMSKLEEYLTQETQQGDSDGDQDSLDGHIKLTKHSQRANGGRRNSSDSSGSSSSDGVERSFGSNANLIVDLSGATSSNASAAQ